MKKSILYGLIASVSMIPAATYAAPDEPVDDASSSALTTKGYVDAGLQYVYDVATGAENGAVSTLQNNVGGLQDTIGSTPMTTTAQTVTGAINELNSAIGGIEISNYDAGVGIAVTEGANAGDPFTIGLALPDNPTAGASYVFQPNNNGGGTWAPLEVEDSWDPGFLTGNN